MLKRALKPRARDRLARQIVLGLEAANAQTGIETDFTIPRYVDFYMVRSSECSNGH